LFAHLEREGERLGDLGPCREDRVQSSSRDAFEGEHRAIGILTLLCRIEFDRHSSAGERILKTHLLISSNRLIRTSENRNTCAVLS
jgi:hypothetical protein